LHNSFERIAEIVRQRSRILSQFRRDFIGGVSRVLGGPSPLANLSLVNHERGEGDNFALV
jgi:hypothetical protein